MEQLLAKQQADTTFEEARLAAIEKASNREPSARCEARARLAEVKRQIDEIEADLVAAPRVEGEPPGQTQARGWDLQTTRAALIAEALMIEQELASMAVRTDLARPSATSRSPGPQGLEGTPAGPGGRGQ